MLTKDIRWMQRFNNFKKAFRQLSGAIELAGQRELSELEVQDIHETMNLIRVGLACGFEN